MRTLILFPVLAGAFLAVGCTTPEIQPVAGDVYVISASASRYSTGKREDLIRQADAYAESRGKMAVAVPQPGVLSGIDRGGVVEYRFRLVDQGGAAQATPQPATPSSGPEVVSPKAEKAAPAEQPAKAIKAAEQPLQDTKLAPPQPEKVSDLYSDLIKLDDLRKRGLLTEEEFQAQKRKLLDGQPK